MSNQDTSMFSDKLQFKLTTMNCALLGFRDDLKKQILTDLMKAPISGMAKAAKIAHIHATRSSSGNATTNCLSLPEI